MSGIRRDSDISEIAARVSEALERAGITAVLSGGAAVTIYTNNAYMSGDLDFISSESSAYESAVRPLSCPSERFLPASRRTQREGLASCPE